MSWKRVPWPRRKAKTPPAISTGKTIVTSKERSLHDERRADIRAEHHRERRDELDRASAGQRHHHQRRRRRGLQRRRHAEPDDEGAEPRAQPAPERAAKIGAEDARDAALHHVDAPEQQRDLADQVDQDMRRGHRPAVPIALCGLLIIGRRRRLWQMSQICREQANYPDLLNASLSLSSRSALRALCATWKRRFWEKKPPGTSRAAFRRLMEPFFDRRKRADQAVRALATGATLFSGMSTGSKS